MRLRGMLTPRLYYGFTAAWLGISLLDGMTRINTVDSHERDRAQRGSVAIGLGYALTRSTTLSFDLAGGSARTWASRTEDSTGALLQNAVADSHFTSAHAAVQSDITRRLFLTASFLQVWQAHGLNVDLFPDRFGNRTSVEGAFFSMNPAASLYASRFSDFGAGWRFTRTSSRNTSSPPTTAPLRPPTPSCCATPSTRAISAYYCAGGAKPPRPPPAGGARVRIRPAARRPADSARSNPSGGGSCRPRRRSRDCDWAA